MTDQELYYLAMCRARNQPERDFWNRKFYGAFIAETQRAWHEGLEKGLKETKTPPSES